MFAFKERIEYDDGSDLVREMSYMRINELAVGPVQTRCYVLNKENGQECIVIDPGDEAKRIRSELEEQFGK